MTEFNVFLSQLVAFVRTRKALGECSSLSLCLHCPKISSKSMQYFFNYLAHRQTDRQTNASKNITFSAEAIIVKQCVRMMMMMMSFTSVNRHICFWFRCSWYKRNKESVLSQKSDYYRRNLRITLLHFCVPLNIK